MAFRKLLFWVHLIVGSAAGLVILMMCVSGVILTYEQQVISWVDRGYRSEPVSAAPPLQLEALASRIPDARMITIKRDPQAPVEATAPGRPITMLDAYTGEALGEGNQGVRTFFRTVTEWHRWFGAEPDNRSTPRAITGAANLAFLGLVVSGLYLWMPRKWSWRHVQPVLWFHGHLSGKARDFNWHNVIGFWCAVPLFFIVVSGAVMSYPWANNLIYRLTGDQPPAAGKPPAPAGPSSKAAAVQIHGLNAAWSLAQSHAPEWQMAAVRLPDSERAPFVFTFDGVARRGRPDQRVVVTVDRSNANSIRVERFDSSNTGRKVRTWLRWIHTGEAGGVAGQTLAGVVSAGGAVLVWTGIALGLRRFRSWLGRNGNVSGARRAPRPGDRLEEDSEREVHQGLSS